ncbi:tyrosine-type recombinase/integrase [Streptomyces fildesensis]|uniref:tyrosine-type recombinase/integrase n=1 Tax=Streptomyces fildesensis TaxID=375757 RepID=UPI0018DEF05B|nr:site-specific integrase [Streptomyces fildesensis]
MAGHIQDRWYKTEKTADGKTVRVKSDRYGLGLRYRARYIGPDGTEKSQSFPDKQKRQADEWLSLIEADMSRGRYIDPRESRITFQQYADKWLASQTSDLTTRYAAETRLRLHAYPYIGGRPMGSFQPAHIRAWVRAMEEAGVTGGYARVIFANVRTVLSAAVDDDLLSRNPCGSRSVKAPKGEARRVAPWEPERVFAVRAALPEGFRPMVDLAGGCGLRQGEIIGFAEDAADFATDTVHVVRQIKMIAGKAVFAPPKGGKLRDVPLSAAVAQRLRAHMERFPPTPVTLPWLTPDGPEVTHRLLFSNGTSGVAYRSNFNMFVWKPALAVAGVIPMPEKGKAYVSAREHGMHALRHFYASALLDAGENIKAVSQYLGHSDPGFTLRIYTHLMPSSQERTRRAIDKLYLGSADHDHGPGTAQAA